LGQGFLGDVEDSDVDEASLDECPGERRDAASDVDHGLVPGDAELIDQLE